MKNWILVVAFMFLMVGTGFSADKAVGTIPTATKVEAAAKSITKAPVKAKKVKKTKKIRKTDKATLKGYKGLTKAPVAPPIKK